MSKPHYLLVGGSNCVINEGYGAILQQKLPGDWTNKSLGNSPSLRGVECLVENQSLIDRVDQIFFEYTLNDLIFEATHTLDPLSHLDWLQCLVSIEKIRKKLIFILLHGQGGTSLIATGYSFVYFNYKEVIKRFGIDYIDLFPQIEQCVIAKGPSAVFLQNDHFVSEMVQILVAKTISEYIKLVDIRRPCGEENITSHNVVVIDPSIDAPSEFCQNFSTSLISVPVVRLAENMEIRIRSPGGRLVGFYAIASKDAGCLKIRTNNMEIVKIIKHRFGVLKPYFVLRHLTMPLHTSHGEEIVFSYARHIFDAPKASLDQTMAQVIDRIGGKEVFIGKFIFLV